MEKIIAKGTLIGGVLIVAVLAGFLVAFPVMFLWNWLMPSIFDLREITFLEAWGLFALSTVLFKNNS